MVDQLARPSTRNTRSTTVLGRAPAGPGRARELAGAAARWAVALALLATVLAVELILLRDHIARELGALGEAGRSSVAPVASAPPPPRAHPLRAGPVDRVDVRALGPCVPGAPCQVRVLVRLLPHSAATRVSWSFQVVDRCTGSTGTQAGGSLPVTPGGDGVAVVDTVALPGGRALGVIALGSADAASAASAPLLVPVKATC